MTRAPRVLVSGLVLDQPMGGVRRHNQELLPRVARILRANGGHLAVLAGRAGIAFPLPAEVEVIASDVRARPVLVRAALEARALARAAEAGGFDLVHTGHLPAPRRLPVPYTLTVHDLRSLDLEHTPFSRRLVARTVIGRALQEAARVFTVSEYTAGRLREQSPAVAGKLTLVPNAADHFEPLPREPGPGAALLHLGHLEPRKNLGLLIRALARDPALPALRLAGASRPEEELRLKALAEELRVTERVHFTGPYEDAELPRLLAECAAVVLPSRLEGFGIPALEALRAGAPLAVSNVGALLEVVGEDVPSFDPDDPDACARAIHAALSNPPAAGGPARDEDWSWDRSARAWVGGWGAGLAP